MEYQRIKIINTDTSEVLGNVLLGKNEELIVKTENIKQAEAIKRKSQEIKDIQEFIQNNEGSYFHYIYKYCYPIMFELQNKFEGNKANIHIVRFMILASYITFKGNLTDNNNNRIKKSSLTKIWDTQNRNGINETFKLLIECKYIYETKEGYLMINEEIIKKGNMEEYKKFLADNNLTYTRIFAKNIQDMYYNTEPKKRPQLANLFKVLPFINYKYNIFCTNPTETDEKKINLLSWNDLAKLCGYEDKTHITKFKKDLWKLKIYDSCVIGEFLTDNGKAICVNPKIYYGGNNTDDVKNLYVMFKMTENKK